MPPALKWVIYARKSTESEDRQVASIRDQVDALQEIAAREGLLVLGVYTESQSAKAPGRPVFNQVLSLIHSGAVNGLLAWKLDRLARNPVDGGQISWQLQQGALRAIRTHERAYLSGDNVLSMSVEFGMAAQYILDLSASVKRGMKSLAAGGYWHSQRTPYGYLAQPTGEGRRKRLVPDPERAPAIGRLFEMLAEGYSLAQIRRALLPEFPDFPTPTHLATLVHNAHYLGHRVYGRRVRQGPGSTRLISPPEHEQQILENTHPALVSQALWDQAQQALASRDPGIAGTVRGHLPLAGLLYCGRCGKSLSGGDQRYHLCYTRRHLKTCDLPAISKARLLAVVLEALDARLWAPDQIREAVQEAQEARRQDRRPKARQQAQRKLVDLERRQARLLEAVEEGAVELAEVGPRLAGLRQELEQARATVDALAAEAEQGPISLELAQALAVRLQEQIQQGDPVRRQQALRAVVRRVLVDYPGVRIEVAFAGAPRLLHAWLIPPPEIPDAATLAAMRRHPLEALVRQVRRFAQDTTCTSAEVSRWSRQRCVDYLEGRRK